LNRRQWWVSGALAATLLTATVSIPMAVAGAEHSAALSDYRTAVERAVSATEAGANALVALQTEQQTGSVECEALQNLVDATPADLILDPAVRDAATTAISAATASVAPTPPDLPVGGEWLRLPDSASTEDLTAARATVIEYTAKVASSTEDLNRSSETARTAVSAAEDAVDQLVDSASEKGRTISFERAGNAEKQSLADAVAALGARKTGADRPVTSVTAELVSAYVSAVAAAKASQDAVIAAEQASQQAAEQAAQQASEEASRQAQTTQRSWTGTSGVPDSSPSRGEESDSSSSVLSGGGGIGHAPPGGKLCWNADTGGTMTCSTGN